MSVNFYSSLCDEDSFVGKKCDKMALIKRKFLVEFILRIIVLNELSGKIVGVPKLINSNNYRRLSSNLFSHGLKMPRSYLYLNYKETYGIRFDPNKIRRPYKNHSVQVETNFDENPGPGVGNNLPSWNDNPSVGVDGDQDMGNGGMNVNDPNMVSDGPNIGNSDPNNGNKDTFIGNMDPNVDSMMSSMMTPISENDNTNMVPVYSPDDFTEKPQTEVSTAPSPGGMTNVITTTESSMMSSETPVIELSSNPSDNNNTRKIYSFTTLVKRINPSKKTNSTNIPTYVHRPSSSSPIKNTLNLIKKRIKQWLAWGTDYNASLVDGQRFLNIFNVIKFENGPCTSTQEGLAEMTGICYQDYQCSELGGIPIDSCADGLGVCCICK